MRRLVGPLVLLALTGGLLFLGVFPARTYLDQRQAISELQEREVELVGENEVLQTEVDQLGTDEELEQIAREQYGFAKPDEEIYYVLPPAEDPIAPPDSWPFDRLGQHLD